MSCSFNINLKLYHSINNYYLKTENDSKIGNVLQTLEYANLQSNADLEQQLT